MSDRPTTVTRIGVPSSKTTVKPFVFSKVELTGTWLAWNYKRSLLERDLADDDNFLAMPSGIGEIKIVISEISVEKNTKALSYKAAMQELPQKVHERSKKGIVHGVRLVSVLYASLILLTCKGLVSLTTYDALRTVQQLRKRVFETWSPLFSSTDHWVGVAHCAQSKTYLIDICPIRRTAGE
jgi:hypothetical protein